MGRRWPGAPGGHELFWDFPPNFNVDYENRKCSLCFITFTLLGLIIHAERLKKGTKISTILESHYSSLGPQKVEINNDLSKQRPWNIQRSASDGRSWKQQSQPGIRSFLSIPVCFHGLFPYEVEQISGPALCIQEIPRGSFDLFVRNHSNCVGSVTVMW